MRCVALARLIYGERHLKLAQAHARLAKAYFQFKGNLKNEQTTRHIKHHVIIYLTKQKKKKAVCEKPGTRRDL